MNSAQTDNCMNAVYMSLKENGAKKTICKKNK